MSFELHQGDALETLRRLPDGSARCCVTSPPYWGLRDYGTATWEGGSVECDHVEKNARNDGARQGVDGFAGSANSDGHADMGTLQYRGACAKCGARRIDSQIGLESTPDAYVARLVEVFREVRRVLTEDGTLWLNLGSSYFGGGNGGGGSFATERPGWSVFGDTHSSQSRRGQRAHAYGSDGTTPRDSTGAGFACSDLCDGCLADWLIHRDRIVDSDRPREQSEPLPSQIDRDSEPSDCVSASPGAWPRDGLASTTLESWRRRRAECSRCDSRASALSAACSSTSDAPAFSRMTWLEYSRRLKHKDMVPTPWMVAFALQADGWYLRSDIIWAKPNPMPESVTDRPTKAHEYVFMLAKSERYYYDADAVREPDVARPQRNLTDGISDARKQDAERVFGTHGRPDHRRSVYGAGRNKRSVWSIATQPYAEAHFAVMPRALVEPCILAGSARGDTVLDPFAGAGTVGLVALRHGRRFVGIELNPTYVEMARRRIEEDAPLFQRVSAGLDSLRHPPNPDGVPA